MAAISGVAMIGCGQPIETNHTAFGRLVVTRFRTAPFPDLTRRRDDYQYRDESYPVLKHYTDSTVAIFIPKSFQANATLDIVVHFHGWRNTATNVLRQFELIEQFTASQRNAVLVVPQGPREAPDSSGGKLEGAGGFVRFIEELRLTLGDQSGLGTNAAIGRIILSGHSGGYRVMAAILDRGGLRPQIREVWLFDGLYADADKYQAWISQSGGRLLNIYTDGGGTKDDSEAMLKWMEQYKVKFLAAEDTRVTPDELRTNRVVFLHTDLGHNDVLAKRKTFQQFAETSCLEPYPPK